MSEFRPHVILNDPDQSWSLLSSNVKLSKASIPTSEVELPFLIAQIDYNPDEFSDHLAILKTIYKVLGGGLLILLTLKLKNLYFAGTCSRQWSRVVDVSETRSPLGSYRVSGQ